MEGNIFLPDGNAPEEFERIENGND